MKFFAAHQFFCSSSKWNMHASKEATVSLSWIWFCRRCLSFVLPTKFYFLLSFVLLWSSRYSNHQIKVNFIVMLAHTCPIYSWKKYQGDIFGCVSDFLICYKGFDLEYFTKVLRLAYCLKKIREKDWRSLNFVSFSSHVFCKPR